MKSPYLNALAAAAYIILIVLGVFVFGQMEAREETILIPMFMLSLFVLSAAIMGFLFVYRPLTMYIDGEKKAALVFFGKTIGSFAILALVLFIVMLFVSPRQATIDVKSTSEVNSL